MTEEPFKRKKDIDPSMLWNSIGMYQQLIMFAILLIVYVSVFLIISRSSNPHPGMENWMNNLHSIFTSGHIIRDVLFGVILGVFAVAFTTLLDTVVAIFARVDLKEWMHRTDYLLPQTKIQKRWAWLISLSGSIQEEIMFRGFILLAIFPLWSHWIWASLILSAFFALLHASVQGFWSTLWVYLISVLLCAIIALGGSIYLAAVTHVTINVCNLFVIPKILNFRRKM